ncbi:GARNL3 (predicted) [Pycnogonum litorale]
MPFYTKNKSPVQTPRPRENRSKSLCVQGPLLPSKVPVDRPNFLEDPKLSVFGRRKSYVSSSATDLVARRGVFSRRHYGSVEMLAQCEQEGTDQISRRFRVENGERVDRDDIYSSPSTPVLENPEYQTRWYFKYFLGKLHQNYVGMDVDKVPIFLSVVLTDANDQCIPQYRAILWRKTGAQRICISYTPGKSITVKNILSNFACFDRLEKGPKEILSPEIQKDMLLLEEQEGSVNFKFGIIYAKAGQITDDEMYSNEVGSNEFNYFTNLLGEKIRLKNWDKYRGGLDVKGDMTGKYSLYTIYEGHEIMFHVSTLLPYSKDNKQQVERKRHIGNDIVNIIFLDGDLDDLLSFKPSVIKSQFTHIFAVVIHDKSEDSYRLHVYSEELVPLFGPTLPCPPVFNDHDEFRDFLLVKLINGEKASFNTPIFAQKRERTLDMLIKDLCSEYTNETRGGMLNRRAFSDVLPESSRGSRRKEGARQVEFVRIGQVLKLDTIVKGDAPTSLATTSLFKREPWEPRCVYPDFPFDIIAGDSLGNNKLIVSTESGVYLVEEGLAHRLIFEKSINVKQLSVVEAHGILLVRADRGRDSNVHVFRLSDFNDDNVVIMKLDLKEHKLDKTRGTHLYAISRPGGSHLRMVVAVGRKLMLMQWRHSAAWTAWCPSSDTDTVEGFHVIREISVAETPTLMTLVDGSTGSENQICIGYKHQFDLINEKTGDSIRLHLIEANKVKLVTALDIYEDDEAELLLCYNHISHFQKLREQNSNEFDFQWNSVPEAIVCAFPYILAFTPDSIEIRLIINGNLVHMMVMPKLKMLTCKSDIYFVSTAPEFFQVRDEIVKSDKHERDPSYSPPLSPHSTTPQSYGDGSTKPLRIYKIPFVSLTGSLGNCENRVHTPSTPSPQQFRAGSIAVDSPQDQAQKQDCRLQVNYPISPRRRSASPSSVSQQVSQVQLQPPPTTVHLSNLPHPRGHDRKHSASSDSSSIKSLGPSPPTTPFASSFDYQTAEDTNH